MHKEYATEEELKRIQEIENIMKPLQSEKTKTLARIRQRKMRKSKKSI